ncbi:HAMP domain-containing protein, partial [Aurantimonas marina]|uniref:HAMP domain-containing protein n=1 Tax=Aurantimonas marina TaxID=2780508 RepID=UPI0019D16525
MLALVAIFAYEQSVRASFQELITNARDTAHITDRIEIDFLEARRVEKNFFLSKNEKVVEEHALVQERLEEDFGHLAEDFQASQFAAVNGKISEMHGLLKRYADLFAQSVTLDRALGFDENSGKRGEMIAAAQELEAKLKEIGDPRLQVMLLTLRRYEKDFMLRQDPKYVASLQKQAAELEKVDFLGFGSPDARNAVLKDLDVYTRRFVDYAETSATEAALRNELSVVFAEVEPIFAAIQRAVEEARIAADAASDSAATLSFYAVLGLAILLTLAIAGVVFLVGRSIASPISVTAGAMRAFAAGDMTADLPQADRKDEIGDMVKALLAFRKSEEQKRAMVAERQEAERLGIEQRSEAEKQAAETARQSFIANVKPAFAALSGGDLTARLDRATMAGFEEICDLYNDSVSVLEETVGSVVG